MALAPADGQPTQGGGAGTRTRASAHDSSSHSMLPGAAAEAGLPQGAGAPGAPPPRSTSARPARAIPFTTRPTAGAPVAKSPSSATARSSAGPCATPSPTQGRLRNLSKRTVLPHTWGVAQQRSTSDAKSKLRWHKLRGKHAQLLHERDARAPHRSVTTPTQMRPHGEHQTRKLRRCDPALLTGAYSPRNAPLSPDQRQPLAHCKFGPGRGLLRR